jgi:hypothetical protein
VRRLAALAVAASCAWAPAAHAYVRSRTSGNPGVPIHWPGTCVFVQPDSAGTPDIPSDQTFPIIQKSLMNWSGAAACGSYLQLNYDQPAPLEAHYDGVNVVKFRTDKWCHPEDAQSHNQCYDAMAAAITTVYFVDHEGDPNNAVILDADVELNNIDFTFVVIIPGTTPPAGRPGTIIADLENTLTHELGHLQGLDHTCKDAATPANEIDDTGNPPPPCNMIPIAEEQKITTATMYNAATPGETKKRSPEVDDLAGICNAYPAAANPNFCEHTVLSKYGTRGCSMASGAPPIALALLLGVLLALRAIARRFRR